MDYEHILWKLRCCTLDAFDIEEAAEAIETLLAGTPGWVSVKDKLPEEMENVIVANKRKGAWDIDKAWRVGNHFHRCGKSAYSHVTHWMPLPKPPT